MDYQFIDFRREGFVATIAMHRPPGNALAPDLLEEIQSALGQCRDEVRVVILTSALEKYFMVGADIKMMVSADIDFQDPSAAEKLAQQSRRTQSAFNEIQTCPCPVIAAINGHALGGGCELALVCDYRFMIDDGRSTIGQTEVNLGLTPGAGGTQRLGRLVGPARATEMLFEGTRLKAPEALAIGLVTRAFPAERFDAEVQAYAERLTKQAPLAVRLIKRALNEGMELPLEKALELEASAFGEAATTQDAAIGISAFLRKETPEFTGK
jgi:enoyl-CoA hydratase/carnithine racemase